MALSTTSKRGKIKIISKIIVEGHYHINGSFLLSCETLDFEVLNNNCLKIKSCMIID
jgi:hypothetical protein